MRDIGYLFKINDNKRDKENDKVKDKENDKENDKETTEDQSKKDKIHVRNWPGSAI